MPLFCSYHILTSSVIYYWTDARQHGIYLLNREYGLTFFPFCFLSDELAKAFRDAAEPQVKFGLYYSLYEWFNPHYLKDKANGFKTDEYVKVRGSRSIKIHTKPRRFFQGFHMVYSYTNSAPILLCHAWQTNAVIWKWDLDFAGCVYQSNQLPFFFLLITRLSWCHSCMI